MTVFLFCNPHPSLSHFTLIWCVCVGGDVIPQEEFLNRNDSVAFLVYQFLSAVYQPLVCIELCKEVGAAGELNFSWKLKVVSPLSYLLWHLRLGLTRHLENEVKDREWWTFSENTISIYTQTWGRYYYLFETPLRMDLLLLWGLRNWGSLTWLCPYPQHTLSRTLFIQAPILSIVLFHSEASVQWHPVAK